MDLVYEIKDRFDDGVVNNIYNYLGVHPVAKLVKDREDKQMDAYVEKEWEKYINVYCAFMFGAM